MLEKIKTYKSESNLYPNWGKEEAEKELKKINNSTKFSKQNQAKK